MVDLIEFENNEAAFSCFLTTKLDQAGTKYLVVGVAKNMNIKLNKA